MSQSSALTMQTPNPMKKKVVAALVAVVIGHVAVLWSVSQMKTPELKQIEKKPIKVKFVKIVEEAPPPPPVEPIKPKVTPKPEPKVEPPKPVVKPKVIAQKPQKTQEKKVIQQDDTLEKQKLEQDRLDKQREQQQREQQQREQQQREQQQREQQQREQQRRAQENTNKTRILSAGEISWVRSPKPKYTNKDLDGSKRTVTVLIDADASGKITNVQITKSSGLPALDDKVLRAVRSAKFKASKDGSMMRASLPLELELNSNG